MHCAALFGARSCECNPQDRHYSRNRDRTSSVTSSPLFELPDRPRNPCTVRSKWCRTGEASTYLCVVRAPRPTHHADHLCIFVFYLKHGRTGISKARPGALPQRVYQQHLRREVAAGGNQQSHAIDSRFPQSTKWDPSADDKDQIAWPNRRRSESDRCPPDIWGKWLYDLDQSKISADPTRFKLRRAFDHGDLAKLSDTMNVIKLNPVARSWLHTVPRCQQEITSNHRGRAEGIVRANETYD